MSTDLTGWEWKAEHLDADLVVIPARTNPEILSVHRADHAASMRMRNPKPLPNEVGRAMFEMERAARLHDGITRVWFCEICLTRRKAKAAAA